MPYLQIGEIYHQTYGPCQILYHGAHQPLTILGEGGPSHGCFIQDLPFTPHSLLNALEYLDSMAIPQCAVPSQLSSLTIAGYDRAALREAELHIEKLRESSQRYAIPMDTPTLGRLMDLLHELVTENPDTANYPVSCCGFDWVLHIHDGEQRIIFDHTLLYEDYEVL